MDFFRGDEFSLKSCKMIRKTGDVEIEAVQKRTNLVELENTTEWAVSCKSRFRYSPERSVSIPPRTLLYDSTSALSSGHWKLWAPSSAASWASSRWRRSHPWSPLSRHKVSVQGGSMKVWLLRCSASWALGSQLCRLLWYHSSRNILTASFLG